MWRQLSKISDKLLGVFARLWLRISLSHPFSLSLSISCCLTFFRCIWFFFVSEWALLTSLYHRYLFVCLLVCLLFKPLVPVYRVHHSLYPKATSQIVSNAKGPCLVLRECYMHIQHDAGNNNSLREILKSENAFFALQVLHRLKHLTFFSTKSFHSSAKIIL